MKEQGFVLDGKRGESHHNEMVSPLSYSKFHMVPSYNG
jgi:hypothetical protein